MKLSVVICTLGRAEFLRRTLSVLNNQTYKNFEVIVVNGPSTDNTEEVMKEFAGSIKMESCPVANLSVSRNIGIKAASGDIVMFIDDDAIPEKRCFEYIVREYKDESVGAVGGIVYDGAGATTQFKYGTITAWGEADAHSATPQHYNNKNALVYNCLMGTNCSFRRSYLLEIGGFDEYYEYYHDESDVVVRMINYGKKAVHSEYAIVYHSFANGINRKSPYHSNWQVIVKNTVYFGIKNSEELGDLEYRKKKSLEVADKWLARFKDWKKNKYITKEDYNTFVSEANTGIKRALADSNGDRKLNFNLENTNDFKIFDASLSPKIKSICLICKDYVGNFGGIQKYTQDLAQNLVKTGANVHIITKEVNDTEISFLKDGINVHTAKSKNLDAIQSIKGLNGCKGNLEYSYGVVDKIKFVDDLYSLDIIETPLWDYEGLLAKELLNIPVVVRMETPLLLAAEIFGWELTEDLKMHAKFEKLLLEKADGLIYISDSIKEEIENRYELSINEENSKKVHLGVEVQAVEKREKTNDIVNILFLGRLERRKGIHTIFEAIPTILSKYDKVNFVLAGRNDIVDGKLGTTYQEYFTKKYKKEKWFNRVIFKGEVSEKEKDELYKNADIYLSPSLYESFGLVFLEAMNYKLPVIGCNEGGMKELITNDLNGYLIEKENSEELASVLEKLIKNPNLITEMGSNGFKILNDKFTSEIMTKNTLDFYQRFF